MKVVQIIGSLETGGAERAAVNLADLLARRGQSSKIVTLLDRDVEIHPTTAEVIELREDSLLRLPFKLRRLLQSESPDAVIVHMAEAAILSRVSLLAAGTGHRIEVIHSAQEVGGVQRLLARATLPLAGTQVAVSLDAASANLEQGLTSRLAVPLPNIISGPTEAPKSSPVGPDDELSIVSVANLKPVKNHPLLLQALQLLHDRHQITRAELHLFGEGESRQEILRLASRSGLADTVHLHGSVPDPWSISLPGRRVSCISSHHEGRSTVQREAGLHRVPTVATAVPGVDPALTFEQESAVPPGDAAVLAAALARVASCDADVLDRDLDRVQELVADEATDAEQQWLEFLSRLPAELPSNRSASFARRSIDLAIGFPTLLASLPLIGILAVLISIESPGSPIYMSPRSGADGAVFTMFKLRTMRKGTPLAATDELGDPAAHTTRLGSVLRRTSLDELPQLVNILMGQMTFIGPRPALPSQSELLALRAHYGTDQLKPGLTGPAQLDGRDELEGARKASVEADYFLTRTWRSDLRLAIRTARCLTGDQSVAH